MYSVLYLEKLDNKISYCNTKGVRNIWRILWLLREVWMKVGLEKIDNHEGVMVKALLDSRATGLFMDRDFAQKKRFKLERLGILLMMKNMDRTINIGEAITHQVEHNMFFKGHIERVRMDICNLEKTEVILGMLWLAIHNPEIDWEKGEVKMMWCPPICGKNKEWARERNSSMP